MEVAAQGYLARTFTAPTSLHSRLNNYSGPSPVMPSQSHQGHSSAHYSTYSALSSRSSDSTQGTSQSTLFPSPPPPLPTLVPVSGAPVEATNSVLNKRAEKETSLFQICLNLLQRLRPLPDFDQILAEEEQEADDDTDPVTLLWRTLRRGYPLLALYNALEPPVRLEVDPTKVAEKNRGKAATSKFLQACITVLKFPSEECFIITDLYGDDTTGFVKVRRFLDCTKTAQALLPLNRRLGIGPWFHFADTARRLPKLSIASWIFSWIEAY